MFAVLLDLLKLIKKKKLVLIEQIKSVDSVLKPGAARLNWTSLGTPEYLLKCSKALDLFENCANQYHKCISEIEALSQKIEDSDLFDLKNLLEQDLKYEVIR